MLGRPAAWSGSEKQASSISLEKTLHFTIQIPIFLKDKS